jgi:hypothetical protein
MKPTNHPFYLDIDTQTPLTMLVCVYSITRGIHLSSYTTFPNNFELSKETKAKIKKLTAEYNRAKVQRNKRLEKELLLKLRELGV